VQDLESKYRNLEESKKSLQESLSHSEARMPRRPSVTGGDDLRHLQAQLETLKEENSSLQEKVEVLEDSNRSLTDQCEALQERYRLLEEKKHSNDLKNTGLQAELDFTRDNLKAAEHMNNKLLNKVRTLEAMKDMDGNLTSKNKTLHEKCAALTEENSRLKDSERTLRSECKQLREKCQTLQHELKEATRSGQSLREQLHEQSMTMEHMLCEMKHQDSLEASFNRSLGTEEASDNVDSTHKLPQAEDHAKLRQQLASLHSVVSERDEEISELKEQLTALSLQQAAMGSPRAEPEGISELKQQIQDLREDVMDKENLALDLQEQLERAQAEMEAKRKDDSTLEHELSILRQRLIQETSRAAQRERTQSASGSGRNEKSFVDSASNKSQQGEEEGRRRYMRSERSTAESLESLGAISSDPDSDVHTGQDVDIIKEMGRLRKDIKRTKAVYANESALFQEALDREHVSHLVPRNSRSPSLTFDFAEMTYNDIPDDAEGLKRIVVKLLDENKSLTTENLRFQLRIREQEALVVEMEEKLSKANRDPHEDWQPLFERQLLLLQKQRDELLHQIFERDSGACLMSSRVGKEVVSASAVQQHQEDLTTKIGELEHCHCLLQQRQAELAHCQAEKRHLEQLLLLKDETERQLMRQKRLLEEELATIEGKLQEREITLAEEKARLLKELKNKERHIFQLQSFQPDERPRSAPESQGPPHSMAVMGRQSASTPRLSAWSQSVQAFFMQQPGLSPCFEPEEQVFDGSFTQQPPKSPQPLMQDPKSYSFPNIHVSSDTRRVPVQGQEESHLKYTGRRHSTGATEKPARFPKIDIPKDPHDLDRFHREAVERLRGKLHEFEVETELARVGDSQSAAVSDYWQRHSKHPH
jgi:septal ring factor EnvC (AmiA/AmiB activator)